MIFKNIHWPKWAERKELQLISCGLGDDGIMKLAAPLCANSTLIDLILFKNELGDVGTAASGEVLWLNASLNYDEWVSAFKDIFH